MIVSIDIGTSYSSISMLGPDGKIQSVDTSTGISMFGSKYSLPSAVFVEDDGNLVLGQAAMNSRMRNPQNFRDEFKRNLGENVPILLGNRSFLPENLYTEFFRHMKSCAEKVRGEQIELAYLTHPAAYGKAKRDKITAAAKAAGLFHVELVDEPTSAAMSYCAAGYVKDRQNLLIYDFGGGTFDASLIRFENGEFRLLAEPVGLERCGGIDIDRLIFQDMISKVDPSTLEMLRKNRLNYMRFASQLSELAVKCKHHLSAADHFHDTIMVGWDSVSYGLTLEQFNGMIASMVGQTISVCRQLLENAGLKISDLSAVLLVGGTSRVHLVQEMVGQMAGEVPVYCADDLELAVSQGALNYRNFKTPEPEPDAEKLFQKGMELDSEEKYEEAFQCYLKAAQMGHAEAQYSLALYYEHGEGTQKDLQEAVTWYRKAAEQGYASAQYNLGVCYDQGEVVAVDHAVAAQWYRKAAEQGHANAQFNLGWDYEHGEGVPGDLEEAKRWYQKAADQGHEKAAQSLKKLERQGSGDQTAESFYQEGVKQGSGDQTAESFYQKGIKLDSEKKYEEAFQWYLKAAQMGHADAQFNLAWDYEHGEGTQKDLKQAVAWYRKAAEQGNANAQYNLGMCYKKGIGVAVNKAEAVKWYRKAAEQGVAVAQFSLGVCYDQGDGVAVDHAVAAQWYRKAAEQGHADAQFNLGWDYEHGEGVPRDLEEAKRWYQKAADQGHEKAAQSLKKLKKGLLGFLGL